MEAQGNILKTLLIVAVVYTLALGAPVKRDTSSNSAVMEAYAAANKTRNTMANCSSTTWNVSTVVNNGSYDNNFAAEILQAKLRQYNFNRTVCEAVQKCLNHSDYVPRKCKLAAAAIELHVTVNKFIAENEMETLQIDCCTSTEEVEDMEKALCDACAYTQEILAGIDGGHPYGSNCTS